jgi:hypothetical protein
VSRDGHIAYGVVQFDQQPDTLPKAAIKEVVAKATAASKPACALIPRVSPPRLAIGSRSAAKAMASP